MLPTDGGHQLLRALLDHHHDCVLSSDVSTVRYSISSIWLWTPSLEFSVSNATLLTMTECSPKFFSYDRSINTSFELCEKTPSSTGRFVDSVADETTCHVYTVVTQSLVWSWWIRVRSSRKQSHIVGCLVDIRMDPTCYTVHPPSVHSPCEESTGHLRLVRYPSLSLPIVWIKDKLITTGRSSISLINKTSSVDVPSIPPLFKFEREKKKEKLNRTDFTVTRHSSRH